MGVSQLHYYADRIAEGPGAGGQRGRWQAVSETSPMPAQSVGAAAGEGTALTLTSSASTASGAPLAANISAGARAVGIHVPTGSTATIAGVDYDGPGTWRASASPGWVLPAITVTVADGSTIKTTVLR